MGDLKFQIGVELGELRQRVKQLETKQDVGKPPCGCAGLNTDCHDVKVDVRKELRKGGLNPDDAITISSDTTRQPIEFIQGDQIRPRKGWTLMHVSSSCGVNRWTLKPPADASPDELTIGRTGVWWCVCTDTDGGATEGDTCFSAGNASGLCVEGGCIGCAISWILG